MPVFTLMRDRGSRSVWPMTSKVFLVSPKLCPSKSDRTAVLGIQGSGLHVLRPISPPLRSNEIMTPKNCIYSFIHLFIYLFIHAVLSKNHFIAELRKLNK